MERFMTTDMVITDIVLCAEVKNGAPIHRNRQSHGLVYYNNDRCTFAFLNGTNLKTSENSIIYLPKGSDYNVITKKAGICYAINFQLSDNTVFSPFCAKLKNTEFFKNAFKDADKHFKRAGVSNIMKCRSILYDIIAALQHEYALGYISGEKRSIIATAVRCIHESYTEEELRIGDLARMCDISPEYFRSIFSSIYGVSPSKYIANLRADRAKELLASGMYSVAETANMCGFGDVSYFSRCFKKIVGMCPEAFKNSSKM